MQQSQFWVYIENVVSKLNFHTHGHSNNIHKSQASQISING